MDQSNDVDFPRHVRNEVPQATLTGISTTTTRGTPSTSFAPVDVDLLIRKASTDKNLTYLVQKSIPLLWQNSNEWIQAFSNVTKANVHRTSPSLFESKEEVSSENFLRSVETLLDLQTQRQMSIKNYRPLRGQTPSDIPQISASTVVQSASALLNVFSAFTGNQDSSGHAKHGADEYTIQRNGLELRRGIRNTLLDAGNLVKESNLIDLRCVDPYGRLEITKKRSRFLRSVGGTMSTNEKANFPSLRQHSIGAIISTCTVD
ncbi:unnamed protein product [Rodentolepis nana]|uniref:Uncharacterized protein n=1 Tax=Rodentolepis nana TaxID=102285 RepID=A0A0R3T444_RODNA|nr:unnamed protein product [Rodentolepis nana]